MAVEDTVPSQLHRLSPDEYRRLVEADVFDEDARVELIDGVLVDTGPKTRAHENAVAWLTRRLVLAVDPERFEVRVGAPLTIATSEPEPDLAVVEHAAPRPNHPATAALVIEVAVSSLTRDLSEKPPIYARAPVPEYAEVGTVSEPGTVEAAHLGLALSVAELLAAAER